MTTDRLQKLVAAAPQGIRKAVPYVAGKAIEEVRREKGISEDIQIAKLASNENPLGPSPRAMEAARLELGSLHYYPDASGRALKSRLAELLGCEIGQILLGNGSENLLDMLARAFLNPSDEVLISDCSFPQYTLVGTLAGAKLKVVEAAENFEPDLEALLKAIGPRTRLCMLGYPDNPSGALLRIEELEQLYQTLPQNALLVMDEAYHGMVMHADYRSTLEGPERFNDGDRAIVTCRTFSKAYGLAGLRVAFAVLPTLLCSHVEKLRLPFNVNRLAQAAALAALGDEEHLHRTQELLWKEKPQLVEGFRGLGLKVIEGAANFILVESPLGTGAELSNRLEEQGLIVRALQHSRMQGFVRVSVGQAHENERLLEALRQLI